MKFTTLIALFASVSAGNTATEQMVLKDQLKSLGNMVSIAQTHKANNMISAIQDRKAELENQLVLAGTDKKGVARELTFLLDLVQNIEHNDFDGATKTLAHRKNKLFKYQMHLAAEEEEEPAAEEEEEPAAEEEEPATEEGEPATEEGEPATEEGEAAPKSKMGGIIGGVAGAVILIGGCVYYKKSQKNDEEGGEKEDRKLFKSTFKGNVVKKVQKEALVPTFAVPAEENI